MRAKLFKLVGSLAVEVGLSPATPYALASVTTVWGYVEGFPGSVLFLWGLVALAIGLVIRNEVDARKVAQERKRDAEDLTREIRFETRPDDARLWLHRYRLPEGGPEHVSIGLELDVVIENSAGEEKILRAVNFTIRGNDGSLIVRP